MGEFSISDLSDDMRFTREELGGFASEILEFFKRENILSRVSLEERLGESFDAKKGTIQIKEHPDLDGAYIISYIVIGRGNPIKVDMNIDLGHYSVTVQCRDEIGGDYKALGPNLIENIVQTTMLEYSWKYIRGALRELMV